MYGWELNENSWQEEKCFVTNDWLDDTLKNIKLELGSKIVSKLIALLQVEEKDAERLSLQIISFYETIFWTKKNKNKIYYNLFTIPIMRQKY